MSSDRSNVPGDGNEGQEPPNNPSDNDDHLPLIKRKRIKIVTDTKRLKLSIEGNLKRPIFHQEEEAIPAEPLETLPPPPAVVFDSESESGSGQDSPIQATLLEIEEMNLNLAVDIPLEYKRLMNFMGGSWSASPNLVVEKKLTKGDVEERRNRLLIPQRKIRSNFIDMEEEDRLNVEKFWAVEIIEPDCSVSMMTLSKWETRKGPAYALINEWNALVERNELKQGDLMQLWSFRAGTGSHGGHGRLCLMLLEIGDGADEADDEFP